MRHAIELAKHGEGFVNPNPVVGCVVVKENRIVASGWHERYGEYHAERNALTRCDEDLHGAEMYVTLEPCCHSGKTPPCTDIIIERGIGTVYIGSDDPNPKVAGKGVRILEEAGINVVTHVLKDECDRMNEIFFHFITTHRPFIAMKYAMTLDGKITTAMPDASKTGFSATNVYENKGEWNRAGRKQQTIITGAEAHMHVHRLRKKYAAIMAGIGTILSDDPMLNVRLAENSPLEDYEDEPHVGISDDPSNMDCNPLRVIIDSHLRIPIESRIVQTAPEIPTVVAFTSADGEKQRALYEWNIQTMHVGTDSAGRVDLTEVFDRLGEMDIDSVLVEGGSGIHGSLLENRSLVNRVYAYISPRIFGGETALSPVGGVGSKLTTDALQLRDVEYISLGNDILITGRT
ncbi:MAG: bifunctional diaminohydroxyphosphoribosylaminopyrimidine deaminase/5-amino-6-(5-phosphoribosylamino)uracil reductase RibD [Eubacterium sp.]|nr:bifunctional diaminohydroxyphosphoribosylaminopyrimidine deaminase/5-amino-6-(5-phosphoribosylamino)uracil reductase RibD [Eubacterium sp.]